MDEISPQTAPDTASEVPAEIFPVIASKTTYLNIFLVLISPSEKQIIDNDNGIVDEIVTRYQPEEQGPGPIIVAKALATQALSGLGTLSLYET